MMIDWKVGDDNQCRIIVTIFILLLPPLRLLPDLDDLVSCLSFSSGNFQISSEREPIDLKLNVKTQPTTTYYLLTYASSSEEYYHPSKTFPLRRNRLTAKLVDKTNLGKFYHYLTVYLGIFL